ncbi:imidazole glycerol phosphate synthase, glutamine amidotransferase subunit [Solidesulfovibrio fructosivorans JJ]]|uniref:Imidazole glycerol phosphate synthase subunit HisH n=1 Tax=Solidesulfovibrio fructosivorans JJ] TaxID=596151 RepID=E1JXR6_SOLFR|nr:imidazole glycerol phosphate synthase subunit HisH [Solidesulfovibrio fructosivorans]EFL50839.1 imidazole glycerol phosphate synthase, glutamine amidotransferase subunit [Solidesulfovibrio fructosivorans JJ]]
MIVIVDHGLGNLRSVAMKFARIKAEAMISADPAVVATAEKLVLPGVGSFDAGMKNLRDSGLEEALNIAVLEKKTPVLGICLGMQLFTRGSEEGRRPGLGWIDAETRRLRPPEGDRRLRVPHVGWNTVSCRPGALLFTDIDPDLPYYFVHSYAAFCNTPEQVAAQTDYGEIFASAVAWDNIWGVQFHPEKSHHHGLRMIENFLRLT